MKKRSLVAALAMLMVSAIVLTSSTYAWFATGTTAKISGVSATVGNEDGSIAISADGVNYSTTLKLSDFEAEGLNNFTTGTFQPVSCDPVNWKFTSGSITQQDDGKLLFETEDATNTNGKYYKLNVYVKSSIDCNVEISADMGNSTYQFIYAAVVENAKTTNYKVYNNNARIYTPVNAPVNGYDAKADSIMTSEDTLASDEGQAYNALGTAVNSVVGTESDKAVSKVTLDLVKDSPEQITLYVWAEGNDDKCVGNIVSNTCTVAFNFDKVAADTNG